MLNEASSYREFFINSILLWEVLRNVIFYLLEMQIRKFTVSVFQGQLFTSIGNKASLNLPQSALSGKCLSKNYPSEKCLS